MKWDELPRTLEEIEALDTDVLTCAQVSRVLRMDVATIHEQAVTKPGLLGFPVVVAKRRVKIPKQPFLGFMRRGYDNF